MKICKKAFSVMLAVLMMVCSAPLDGFVGLDINWTNPFKIEAEAATYSGTCGANLTWTFSDDTLYINGTGDMEIFTSEQRLPWYSRRSRMKKVLISHGVTSISQYAFWSCQNLISVEIPDSVTGNIGNYTFYNCLNLTSVEIPEGITSIGKLAFGSCGSLTSINIPDSVISIGESAFGSCKSLTSIEIPDGVTSIGESAFYNCSSLTNIKVGENNQNYSTDEFGVLFDKNKTTLIQYPIGNDRTNYIIPNGVTSIYKYAFYSCKSLMGIDIPDSVTSIGNSAFSVCTSLTNIDIPNSVTSIGQSAFAHCSNLTSAKISDNVTNIGSCAFDYCSSLTSIEIPESVTSIGSCAFGYCTSLISIEFSEGVTNIGTRAFEYCSSLISIRIPDSVTDIDVGAFTGCFNMKSVNIPDSITKMADSVFCDCSSLTNIEIPEGVTSIGDRVFSGCKSLTSIEIPESVTSIGGWAFEECIGLTSIEIPDGVTYIDAYTFASCSGLISIEIPDSVTSIGSGAFQHCSSITSIEIPDTVTSIGIDAFQNCSSITSIEIPEGVTSIEDSLFSGCPSLTKIELPESVTSIGYNAFNCCTGLTSIELPEGVVSIGRSAFNGCTNLGEIVINNPKCDISDYSYTFYSGITIYGYANSTAQAYAEKYSRTFVEIECQHEDTSEYVEILPTCTSIGYTPGKLCNKCKTWVEGHEEISALGHSYGCVVVTPTCTAEGYTTHTCNVCRDSYTDAVVNALGHAYGGWTVSFAPTCIATGLEQRFCLRCDEKETQTIEALGHAYGDWTISLESTCTNSGVANKICSKCNAVETQVIEALGHAYGEWIVSSEPTCAEKGLKHRFCSRCNDVENSILPTIDHNYGEWLTDKEATVLTEGLEYRICDECGNREEATTERVVVDIEENNEYGLANLTVVNAQTLEPIQGANIFVSTDSEGEATFSADDNGCVSIVLPVGENIITVYSKGLISRTLTIDIINGENEIPAIGLSSSPIVEAELITTPMTKEEIEDAGIDVTAPGNNNVIKYEAKFEFAVQDPTGDGTETKKETINQTFYVNGNGDHIYQQDNNYEVFGKPVTIYPTERFFLIITGDIIWLKEMFHVQLYAYNNSNTDWIEDAVATLQLPEGLSLADMNEGEQTLSQLIGTIPEGGQVDCEWYVRGDKEGIYDLTAKLEGRIMPFNESFSNEYTAESAIKVYSGKAFNISFEVPTTTYCGDEYPVKIVLKNVSDKPIYNVSHILTGISQTKVTHYSDGTVVEEIYVNETLDASKFVDEFNPGDEIVLELTANILFKSEKYKDCLFELVDIVFNAKELGTAINNNFGFPTEHDWGEWVTAKEPTCGEFGLEKRVCKHNEDHIETRNIDKIPHDWDEGVIDPTSTCNTHGTKTYTCQNDASHTYTEEVPLDENNHVGETYIKDDKAATCLEDGYTGDTYCSDCDKLLENGEAIPATGHDWGEWTTVTSAICEADGIEKRVCKNDASHVEMNLLPAINHDWDEGVIDPESTCNFHGTKTYTCQNDASHTYTEEVPFDENNHVGETYIKDDKEATCLEDGYTGDTYCSDCDKLLEKGEVIGAHGHDYHKIAEKGKAPDYGIAGYDYYECSYNASHNYKVEIAPLVKTTFTATFVTTAPFFKEDKVIAEVTFVQGDKFVEEPAVDKYDNYTFAWDEYELQDEDIVIYGRYTEIEINDITTPEAKKKAEYNNGVATITLEAKAGSKNIKILSEKTKPVDVILALDQSGSMAETLSSDGKTKRDALVECANDFVNEIYANALATGAEHRVAVVGFSYSDYNGGNYKNTGILATSNGKSINYKSIKDADYASALMSVVTANGINSNIIKGINSVVADGATSAHLGLEMANNIFALTEKEAGRERIVLFITDGTPTSWGEETDLVKATAAKAITEANELKNAQGAKVYSIGVHANADPTASFTSDDYGVATDSRGTFKSYDFNRFLHAISSNYPDAGSIRVSEMGEGSKNSGYYLGVQDTSKLNEIFSKILLSNVYEVKTFDKVTIVDTISKEFTLTLEQETEMRERLTSELGIRNEDITVVRNEDGTTTLRFENIRTQKVYNADGTSYYSAKVSFDVSADEDSLGLTKVNTNTEDAGVEYDGEIIEKFEVPAVVLEPDRKLVVFTVNGTVYRIEEAKLGDNIVAPESQLAEWNVPEGTVVDSDYVVFEADTVESTEYTVTWISENSKKTDMYSFGEWIVVPDATEKEGYTFVKWSPLVPATMPNYNIIFTAVYTPKHTHEYVVSDVFGKCTEGITTVYECACGDSYEEKAEATEHSAKAIVEKTSDGTLIEKVTCQICGAANSQKLTYKVTYRDGWRNTVLDLTLLENDVYVQPDGSLEIRFYVGEKINKSYTVYRIDENANRTTYTPRKENGYLIFDADHFSFYVIAEVDETTGEIADEMSYGEVYCASNGHSYTSVVISPTCTSKGYTTYTCASCGDGYTADETEIIAHSFGSWATTQYPTCTTTGLNRRDCSNCDHFETNIISATGHKEAIIEMELPTCTQNGLTEGKYCTVCKTVLAEQEVIPATGHDYVNGTCTNCGDSRNDNCSCNCHKTGFMGFIWKILNFFYKIFKTNRICGCGAAHY